MAWKISFNTKSGSHDVSWLGWFGPPISSRTPPNLRPAWDCRRSMDWCRWQLGIAAMIPEPAQRSQWKCVAPFASQVSHIHSFRLTVVYMEVNCQILSTELKLQQNHRTAGYFRTTICLPFLPLYESLHINGILTPGVTAYPSHDPHQLRAALSYHKARLQTFRSNHAVAPLSLPCIPWIPGEKTRVSHSETVETGQETVWSNAGEGVKSVNTGHSDDY